MLRAISTSAAPHPAGSYSQAMIGEGKFVFVSGQTPRRLDGSRLRRDAGFEEQAWLALKNLEAIAKAAGVGRVTHGAKVTVYLKNLNDRYVFDHIYASFVGDPLPARKLVQSNFTEFDIEIDAIFTC